MTVAICAGCAAAILLTIIVGFRVGGNDNILRRLDERAGLRPLDGEDG